MLALVLLSALFALARAGTPIVITATMIGAPKEVRADSPVKMVQHQEHVGKPEYPRREGFSNLVPLHIS
jgi:hypothetical protein